MHEERGLDYVQLCSHVFAEINAARQSPHLYQRAVEAELRCIGQDGVLHRVGYPALRLREGVPAYHEASLFLSRQSPLPPLQLSPGLAKAAQEHALDIGGSGLCGHEGSDGSKPGERASRHGDWQGAVAENIAFDFRSARDAVLQLIVDDGVPERGHRRNIFSERHAFAGVGCGPHRLMASCCVVAFAAQYTDKRRKRRPSLGVVSSAADAAALATKLLSDQRALGLSELADAATEAEAIAKARLLLAHTGLPARAPRRRDETPPATPPQRPVPEPPQRPVPEPPQRPVPQPPPAAEEALPQPEPEPVRSPRRETERCLGACVIGGGVGQRPDACFVGDRVAVLADVEAVRLAVAAQDRGGWNDLITGYCGSTGVVTKVLGGGLLQVRFGDGEQWLLPGSSLRRPPPAAATAASGKQLIPNRVPAPAAVPEAAKALLIGADYRGTAHHRPGGVQDCRTARAFLHDRGFEPKHGTMVLADEGGAEPPTRSRVLRAFAWLCDGVRAGDALFVFIGCKRSGPDGGILCSADDGTGTQVLGSELLSILRSLPRGVSLLGVVDGGNDGGAVGLAQLHFVLRAEADGGTTESRRPLAPPMRARVTFISCEGSSQTEGGSGLLAAVASAIGRGKPPNPQQLLSDTRRQLQRRHGRAAPTPLVASTMPLLGDAAVSLGVPRERRRVRGYLIPAVTDAVEAAAALLPAAPDGHRWVPLGDADARSYFSVSGGESSVVTLRNGHPCFVLNCYNWLENDVVRPLGDTAAEPHPSGAGPVLRCRVLPGETKPFLEGVLSDGEDWRPGWRQEPLTDEALRCIAEERRAEVGRQLADAAEVNARVGETGATSPFASLRLLDECVKLNSRGAQLEFADLWFPPQDGSVGDCVPKEAGELTWGRPRHWLAGPARLVAPGGRAPVDVGQGWLCDGGLLGAMAALAELPCDGQPADPLSALFCTHQNAYAAAGAYRLCMCAKGWWHDVTVDSWLPTQRRPRQSVGEHPAFSYGRGTDCPLWPSVVEKAAAKVHGGYAALETVTPGDALADLTGFPVEDARLARAGRPQWGDDAMPLYLAGALEDGAVVVLTTREDAHLSEDDGPLAAAPYALLRVIPAANTCLLQIRDVWSGAERWRASRWGPGSALWTDELRARAALGDAYDGTRWVDAAEAAAMFNACWLCHVPPPNSGELRLWVPWQGGGPSLCVEVQPDAPTRLTVVAHGQGPLEDPCQPLQVSVLGMAAAGGWEVRAGAEHCQVDGKRVVGVFDLAAGCGPVTVVPHLATDAPPPNGGVVLSLHYHHSSHPQLPLGGRVVLRGPAAPLQEQLRRRRSRLTLPAMGEVEAVAQQRRFQSESSPPVDPFVASEFEL